MTIQDPAATARRVVAAALRAPSVYNTQPWRFAVHADGLDLLGDPTRRLPVLDPSGREYFVSLGAALFTARVAYAATDSVVAVHRFPRGERDDLVASVRVTGEPAGDEQARLALLEPEIARRSSNRRAFFPDPVPVDVRDDLVAAAAAEDAVLVPVTRDDDRAALARLVQHADRAQNADPSYRAELRRWTRHDPTARDGVSQLVVPAVDGHSGDEVPLRDFDTYGLGWLPSRTRSGRDQCLLLLTTQDDEPHAWLRAGEALQRVLLVLTRHGFAASLFSQPIEVDSVRDQLRGELGLLGHPQLLLRVGRAAATPSSLRRPLADVVVSTPRSAAHSAAHSDPPPAHRWAVSRENR